MKLSNRMLLIRLQLVRIFLINIGACASELLPNFALISEIRP